MYNKNEEEEEPSPEILPSQLNQNQNNNQNLNEIENQNIENKINNNQLQSPTNPNQSRPRFTESKNDSSRIKTSQNLNISKVSKTNSYAPTNKYENHNIQQLTYALMKDYSQLHINKDENFMERMKFDIYKRQIREDRINKLVEQNKIKIDEEERIKAFNRLIEDANRRIEAQENLESMKNKLEDDLITPNTKKYNENEWKEIYQERFKKHNDRVNDKIERLKKEKNDEDKKKEEEELKLCPNKKASKKHIEEASKRMYDEAIKRKLKMEEKKSRINNVENDPSKYRKVVKSEAYSFLDDEDDFSNKKMYNSNNQRISKKKNQAVTEFNNQRFDVRNKNNPKPKIFNDYNRNLYGNNYNYNYNRNINNNYNINNYNTNYNNNSNNNREQIYNNENDIIPKNENVENNSKKNLEEYLEDETEIKEVPKPVGMAKELMVNEIGNNMNMKKLEDAAIKRLSQRNENEDYENEEENNNIVTYNSNNKASNEASKIVEQFFTNNLKH